MKTIELKTNIMCSSCVAKVTSVLNEAVGETNWKVDIQDPKKVLTVTTEELKEDDVKSILSKVEFRGEALS